MLKTRNDFPLTKGETLNIKDGQGRVVEQWHVTGKPSKAGNYAIWPVAIDVLVPQ